MTRSLTEPPCGSIVKGAAKTVLEQADHRGAELPDRASLGTLPCLREGARSKIRVMVKRILNKYGSPPDLQEEAVKTIPAQAELLCAEWV